MSLVSQARYGLGTCRLIVRRLGVRGAIRYARALVNGNDGRRVVLIAKQAEHPLVCRIGSSDLDVFRQIFVEGEYAPLDSQPGATFILDCGAYVGYSAAYLASLYPEAELVAVEPDPASFELLEANVAPYGERIRAIRAGIWSSRSPLVVDNAGARDDREWSNRVRVARADESSDLEGIDIGTLLCESGRPVISILKLDIEGAEANVLSENADAWLDRVGVILVELHDDLTSGEASAALERATRERDFERLESGELTVLVRRSFAESPRRAG